MRTMIAALILIASASTGLRAAAERKSKIAVLDVQTTGIDPETAPVLTEMLTADIHAIGIYDVIAGRDIQAMLGFEAQ